MKAFWLGMCALLWLGGCMAPGSKPMRIACQLSINQVQPGSPGSYNVEMKAYDEATGGVIAEPKLLLNANVNGTLRNGADCGDDAVLLSESFGAVPCDFRGFQCLMRIAPSDNPEAVQVKLLLFWLSDENGVVRTGILDGPACLVPVNQTVLLVERAGDIVVVPVDLSSAASIAEAREWSPFYGNWQ